MATAGKDFFHGIKSARDRHNNNFAEFGNKGDDDRNQAKFLRCRRADNQCGQAVFRSFVRLRIVILVAVARIEGNGIE